MWGVKGQPERGWIQLSFRCCPLGAPLRYVFGVPLARGGPAFLLPGSLAAAYPEGEIVRGLVIASGKGSRLRTPRGRVKPLVSVAGVALLERAVRNLVDVGVDEVVVVVGYRAEKIERFCVELSVRLGVSLRCVRNDRYDEGNGLSVLAAEDALRS